RRVLRLCREWSRASPDPSDRARTRRRPAPSLVRAGMTIKQRVSQSPPPLGLLLMALALVGTARVAIASAGANPPAVTVTHSCRRRAAAARLPVVAADRCGRRRAGLALRLAVRGNGCDSVAGRTTVQSGRVRHRR